MPLGKAKFLSKKKSASSSRGSKSKPSVKLHPSRTPAARTNTLPYHPARAPPSRPTKKGPAPRPTTKPAPPRPTTKQGSVQQGVQRGLWGEALYPFAGQMACDISFRKSERIEILTKTQCEFDWWEGRVNGRVGIFPANYVRVVG